MGEEWEGELGTLTNQSSRRMYGFIYLDFTSRRLIYTHFKTQENQITWHHSSKLDYWVRSGGEPARM